MASMSKNAIPPQHSLIFPLSSYQYLKSIYFIYYVYFCLSKLECMLNECHNNFCFICTLL